MRIASALVLLGAFACAHAQAPATQPPTPQEFAYAWPLVGDAPDGVLQVTLTPEIYAELARDDLADLAAFNASDVPIPFGPVVLAPAARAVPEPIDVPIFRVPRAVRGESGAVTLRLAQDGDGRLRRLDAELASLPADDEPHDLLLDLSGLDGSVVGLVLALESDTGRLNARVDVEGSRDLSVWHGLIRDQAVVSLRENRTRLERLRIEFAATDLPYLRLRRVDRDRPLPIASVQALHVRNQRMPLPERTQSVLAGDADGKTPGAYVYRSAGPFPVERIAVELAERNAVAQVVVESRADPGLPWRERARGTAFRLADAEAVGAAPFDTAPVRDRHWRVRSEPAQARAPTLTLGWRPDRFVLLAQGAPPYRLAAGSRRAVRQDYPIQTVLTQLQARQGDGWLPPRASLGARIELGGDRARLPRPPSSEPASLRHWLLWGVLLAGAAFVIGMVLHLLRQAAQERAD